ncbi:MAG: hypothetical protein ABIK82_06385 [Pseudomonadota bacterium]
MLLAVSAARYRIASIDDLLDPRRTGGDCCVVGDRFFSCRGQRIQRGWVNMCPASMPGQVSTPIDVDGAFRRLALEQQ